MKEVILLAAVIAVMIFGYFIMKRLDSFLEENQKHTAKNQREGDLIGILSFQLADGRKVSEDYMENLSERYPSVEFTLRNKRLDIVCKRENAGETEAFISSFFAMIEKDI